jgi:UDPglucose 6-dehydrogenase
MLITVTGCGYLGAVHAACMARLGHHVVGIDTDPEKAALLNAGTPVFYEPGFAELLADALATGRLSFTTDVSQVQGSSVHFVCVGTPQRPGSKAADLTYLDAAVSAMLPYLSPGDLVVGKSTVPVGTAERLAAVVAAGAPGARLAWNPEFLREGFAIADTLRPDRLVFGLSEQSRTEDLALLQQVYASALAAETPVVVTDYATAELVKVAANSFLATKISFINAMAEICDVAGADVVQLADALGHDQRIGRRFLNAGLGFGGGCLPKDIRAFGARADELGVASAVTFLAEVDAINLRCRDRAVDLVAELCGPLPGVRVAVLGAAFKPDSDDVRDAPALHVAGLLQAAGARVVVTDPQAADNARKASPDLAVVDTVDEAVAGADVVLLLTEWDEYRRLDPEVLSTQVANRNVVDARNALDAGRWRAAGWTYRALGRS